VQTYNGSMGGLQFYNNRPDFEAYLEQNHPHMFEFRKQLYPREVKVRYRPGTLLLYRQDVWHRGTPLIPGTVRYVHNLAYKRTGCDWVTNWHTGWAKHFYETPALTHEPWFAKLSVSARSVLGFPPPGHKYWTKHTLQLCRSRWAPWGMDMKEYEDALERKQMTNGK